MSCLLVSGFSPHLLAAADGRFHGDAFVIVIMIGLAMLGFGLAMTPIVMSARGWLEARSLNAGVSLADLIAMRFRRVNWRVIVRAKAVAVHAGLPAATLSQITTRRLVNHYLAGGSVPKLVRAIVTAKRAGHDLDFDLAATIDLTGHDLLEAVHSAIVPQVIDCPYCGQGMETAYQAIAKDGSALRIRVQLVVWTDLTRVVDGGAKEALVAQATAGIVNLVATAKNHRDVDPEMILKGLLKLDVCAGTRFRVQSINVVEFRPVTAESYAKDEDVPLLSTDNDAGAAREEMPVSESAPRIRTQ